MGPHIPEEQAPEDGAGKARRNQEDQDQEHGHQLGHGEG